MLKNFSWDTFKKTGDIQAYCLYKEIEKTRFELSESLTPEMSELRQIDGVFESKGDNNSGK